jgi:hypothetical protein
MHGAVLAVKALGKVEKEPEGDARPPSWQSSLRRYQQRPFDFFDFDFLDLDLQLFDFFDFDFLDFEPPLQPQPPFLLEPPAP